MCASGREQEERLGLGGADLSRTGALLMGLIGYVSDRFEDEVEPSVAV